MIGDMAVVSRGNSYQIYTVHVCTNTDQPGCLFPPSAAVLPSGEQRCGGSERRFSPGVSGGAGLFSV